MESAGHRSRGLSKLLLRRPDLRPYFPSRCITDPVLKNLCEAYDETTAALEALYARGSEPDLLAEYADLCRSLEDEVEFFCRNQRR